MKPSVTTPSRFRLARGLCRAARRAVLLALACGAIASLGSGCASTWWRDRANDLGDIASVSFGAGLGVRAQAGPVATGLGAQMDVAGFRGGRFFCDRRAFDLEPLGWSVDLVLASGNLFGLRPADGTPEPYDRIVNGRGKYQGQYNPAVGGVFVPFWLCGEILDLDYYGPERTERPSPLAPNRKEARPHLPSWTHLEAAAALGVGVRLGFNPGELLDFLLGFFGADLYGDDLARGEGENPHAESAEIESHAESAETVAPEPHAESAEFAEH